MKKMEMAMMRCAAVMRNRAGRRIDDALIRQPDSKITINLTIF